LYRRRRGRRHNPQLVATSNPAVASYEMFRTAERGDWYRVEVEVEVLGSMRQTARLQCGLQYS
jgi:hypothetical protein